MLKLVFISLFLFASVNAFSKKSIRLATLDWKPYVGRNLHNNGFIYEVVKKAFEKEDYEKALLCHKGTKTKLDVFFNNVLVDVEDSDIKTNRLNLLSMIRSSFGEYADFSLIDVGN